MKAFAYECPSCGPIESRFADDLVQCRCGQIAKRRFAISVNRTSLKSEARFDPVVGAYVENERQFRSLLAQGVDEQSQKLNMDVKVQTVDARDTDALSSLHGHSPDLRKEHMEPTLKAQHDSTSDHTKKVHA